MNLLPHRINLPLYSALIASSSVTPLFADVNGWWVTKARMYQQESDATPATPTKWICDIGIEVTDGADASSASLSGGSISGSIALEFNAVDNEWRLEQEFNSEAELDAFLGSGQTYTLSLSGGTLGNLTQTFTFPSPNYPSVPALTDRDWSKVQSLDTAANFELNWTTPAAGTSLVFLDIENDAGGVNYEYDSSIPSSQIIPANSLTPGHFYEGELGALNSTFEPNTGGFASEGSLDHAAFTPFTVAAVMQRAPQAIVGAWQFGNGASDDSGAVVFIANGTYFLMEDGAISEEDGLESGTYTWNEDTGVLTVSATFDNNGDAGLSDPAGTMTVEIDGDSLLFSDNGEETTLSRVGYNPSSPIVGGWRLVDNGGANKGVIVLLDNGVYFHGETGTNANGQSGMECGTYDYNTTTDRIVSSSIRIDNNGEWGLSDPIQGYDDVLKLTPRFLTVSDAPDEIFHLDRVSNASVLADWSLTKTINYIQASANVQPTTVDYWDVYTSLETMNPNDVSSVIIEGGGISGSLAYSYEGDGRWTYYQEYDSQESLDALFPEQNTYTITVSGGALGTISQQIDIGEDLYPVTPYLTGTNFTDAQSIDRTQAFTLHFNNPGSSMVTVAVTELQAGDGSEYLYEENLGISSFEITAQTLPLASTSYGYLGFSNNITSADGVGGFGVNGNSSRYKGINDFVLQTLSTQELVDNAFAEAGLTGEDSQETATPFDDGVSNLMKYAFGMDLSSNDTTQLSPGGSGTSGLPAFVVEPSANPEADEVILKVEFIRRKGAGLVYTAEHSTTLGANSYTPMNGAVTITPINEQFERVSVSKVCDPNVNPACFSRVKVSTAP